jgi:hypothetical protein
MTHKALQETRLRYLVSIPLVTHQVFRNYYHKVEFFIYSIFYCFGRFIHKTAVRKVA